MQQFDNDITGEHLLYDPELSASYQQSDYQCSISFGSGGLEGVFGWDDVWLNFKADEPSFHIKQQ